MGFLRRLVVRTSILLLVCFVWFWFKASATPPEAPAKVDAIIVLTGGAERVASGLRLLADGAADRLYVSGAGTDVMVADLLAQSPDISVPNPALITLGRARDTEENAIESAAWLDASGIKSARLVTSYYHMPRSQLLLEDAAPDVTFYPTPVEPETINRNNWWKSPNGWGVIGREFFKFLAAKSGLV
jgi:uncharacterized SAM-binding protein YcdF (DUF218 family)